MAGISSKAAGKGLDCGCGNKKGYNGNEIQSKEFTDGSGLELYDFNARTYDQQIGRFIQIDPMTDEGGQESLSPFHFSYNNPVLYSDPDGKCPLCVIFAIPGVKEAIVAGVAAAATYVITKASETLAPAVQKAVEDTKLPEFSLPAPDANAFIPVSAQMAKAKAEKSLSEGATQGSDEKVKEIVIDGNKHPQSAQHGKDASENGSEVEGVVDRKGAADRRRENLKGTQSEKGKDRDEFPPAVIRTNGPVSVRLIDPSDNRGAGGSIGRQLRNVPDNTRIVIKIKPPAQ
jgi:RHS repeat-associated protein